MKKEEKRLIEIIRDVLAGKNKSEWSMQISKEEIERVIKCARVHGVLPFLQECPVIYGDVSGKTVFLFERLCIQRRAAGVCGRDVV